MNERDLIATQTIKMVSEGGDQVRADLKATAGILDQVATSSVNLANQTETSARRQTSASAAFNAMARSLDPAAKAFADLERNQRTFGLALNQNLSALDKAGQGLDVYARKLGAASAAAEALRRQQANLITDPNAENAVINNKPVSLNQITGSQTANMGKDYAQQFAALLDMADAKAAQIGKQFGESLDASMISGASKSARDSAAVFSQELDRLDEIARQKAMQAGKNFQDSLNASMGIGSSGKLARDSALVFEEAARAQDALAASAAKLNAAFNPLEAEQGRLASQLVSYKAALDAGAISQEVYRAEVEKSGQALAAYAQKLNSAEVAAENLRRQQSNLSTNTTAANTSNPTQITGAQLSNVNTSGYAAQFEAAAKAQDDQAASLTRLHAAIRPVEVEQGKLAAELAGYKKLLDEGKIGVAAFAEAQAAAGKRLADFSQSLKTAGSTGRVMSGELVNMSYQLNDVVTGLALGQSPFMIMAQQGGQVVQILQNSKASIGEFARTAVASFGSIFTAGRLAFAGVAGAVGVAAYSLNSFMESQREVGQSLIGIGARTGQTISDINKFATANASATGLSIDQARSVAVEFNKLGMVSVSSLKGLGDAVHGYSILTGTNATEATKTLASAMSGDLVAGAKELNKTYGFLNPQLEDNIRSLQVQGQRVEAVQLIINAMDADNKRAAESVGLLTKAWDALGNAASKAKNVLGGSLAPASNEDQLAALERQKAAMESATKPRFTDPMNLVTGLFSGITVDPNIDRLNKAIDELKEKIASVTADGYVKEMNRIQMAGDDAVRSIVPQIAQIEKLEQALADLERAKATVPVGSTEAFQDNGAELAIRNQITALKEAQAETSRYNEYVAAISQSWGNVTQSTALQLNALQIQLPVVQAITEAARMRAQEEATVNTLLAQGKPLLDAQAVASAQLAISQASATTAVEKQISALKDSTAMIRAQQNGTEASTAAAIAYKNAIASGASETSAAALAAATLANNMARAANNADRYVVLAAQAGRIPAGYVNTSGTSDGTYESGQYPGGFTENFSVPQGQRSGGASLFNPDGSPSFYDFASEQAAFDKYSSPLSDIRARSTLGARGSLGSDKFATAVTKLDDSVGMLIDSNDALRKSNEDLLSPYYTQDPRTSHIGFRSQGMATGGYVDVPGGLSANDNMMAMIPVASGERIYVDPQSAKRGVGGGSQTINVNVPITIVGNADADQVGRTVFQASQGAARQLAAAAK